jgi:hypothetical protein
MPVLPSYRLVIAQAGAKAWTLPSIIENFSTRGE